MVLVHPRLSFFCLLANASKVEQKTGMQRERGGGGRLIIYLPLVCAAMQIDRTKISNASKGVTPADAAERTDVALFRKEAREGNDSGTAGSVELPKHAHLAS